MTSEECDISLGMILRGVTSRGVTSRGVILRCVILNGFLMLLNAF